MVTQAVQLESPEKTKHALSVSVVVPTRDRSIDLERCLESISQLNPSPIETIVVDSAPRGEGSNEVALRWGARYIRENVPGASRARNRGAREASGDIIAYTDDDAIPHGNWLGSILDEFKDDRVALVAGRAIPPAGEPSLDQLYELCGFTGQSKDRAVVDRSTPDWFQKVNFQPFGIGPNLAVRRNVLEKWGGFDERLGPGTPVPGHEEQHAFLELIELGFRLVYSPSVCVTHPSHESSARELQTRSLRRMQASSAYFTLLMVEEPKYWGQVLAYVFGKLLRRAKSIGSAGGSPISQFRSLMARLQGPGLYFKSRFMYRPKAMDVQ